LDPSELAECVIRIDERLKTVSEGFRNFRDDLEEVKENTLILRTEMSNHLSHHEAYEARTPSLSNKQLVGYTGGTAAIVVAIIEILTKAVGGI